MADELEKTCENCKYEFESCEGEHCRHCIHSAEEHFEPKIIVPTEAEIRAKAIDEFVANAERWNNNIKSIRNEDGVFTIENIRKVAEQMKVGAV